MKIYDIVKCSFVDYPGKISVVLFTRGCNIHCRYCHNAHIIPYQGDTRVTEDQVWEFLNKREGIIPGVVVTGGEPTIQPDIVEFLTKLRTKNYSIKLDTNGYRPDVLKRILDARLVDYVAMDIKAPKNKYEKITQAKFPEANLEASIQLIKQSGIDHQFRTTYDKRYLNDTDLEKIREWIKDDSFVVNECILRNENGEPINA